MAHYEPAERSHSSRRLLRAKPKTESAEAGSIEVLRLFLL